MSRARESLTKTYQALNRRCDVKTMLLCSKIGTDIYVTETRRNKCSDVSQRRIIDNKLSTRVVPHARPLICFLSTVESIYSREYLLFVEYLRMDLMLIRSKRRVKLSASERRRQN